jgi:hypothetical protein
MRKITALWLALTLVLAGMVLDRLASPPKARAASQFANILCDTFAPVSSASSVQAITAPNANMFIYVCNFGFGSIGGSDYSIVEGTGSTCGTGTKAMFGGTTAAAGMGLAANGTFEEGSGVGAILKTAVAGDNVCLIVSGTGPLAGGIAYTLAPF